MNPFLSSLPVLKDLVPPEPLLPKYHQPAWVWFALSAGIIAFTVLAVYLIRRVRKGSGVPGINVRQVAYRAAQAELATAPAEPIQETSTVASSALRRYLAAVSGDPALFETHEEFVSRHQALAKYPENLRNATSAAFARLARLKYGKNASGDPSEIVSEARNLLDQLHHHIPAA